MYVEYERLLKQLGYLPTWSGIHYGSSQLVTARSEQTFELVVPQSGSAD
jgi:hypothetical protein